MKIRYGFVSNSSSSSYILYKGLVSKKEYKDLMNYLWDLENLIGDDGWGDSGETYYEHNNYLFIEMNHLNSEQRDEIVKIVPDFFKKSISINF